MDYKNEQSKRMKLILIELDAENKKCADCSKENVEFASINNGIVICSACAEIHKNYGSSISYLKSFSERWDDYLLSYVKLGSNGRFNQIAKSYRIEKVSIETKYKTKACEYYRDLLRSEVMGYDPPETINIRTAAEIQENIEDNYPEFINYSYVKHVDLDNLTKKMKKNEDNDGLLGAMTGFLGNVSSKIDTAADYVASLNVGEKMLEEGSKALNVVKNVVNENTKKLQGFIEEIVKSDSEEKIENNEDDQTKDNKEEDKNDHDNQKEQVVKEKTDDKAINKEKNDPEEEKIQEVIANDIKENNQIITKEETKPMFEDNKENDLMVNNKENSEKEDKIINQQEPEQEHIENVQSKNASEYNKDNFIDTDKDDF